MTVAVLETAGRYQTGLTGCAGRLKDYVLANMMWDPTQDPDALISEFLIGYYSELGAPFVRKYMDTMHAAVSALTMPFLLSVALWPFVVLAMPAAAELLHSTAWNCLSGRAGWSFAQVDETNFYLNSCCTAAPEGTSKAYLHPLSLITSSREAS